MSKEGLLFTAAILTLVFWPWQESADVDLVYDPPFRPSLDEDPDEF